MVVEDGSKITVVHLIVPGAPFGPLSLVKDIHWRIACMPNVCEMSAGRPAPILRTDDPRGVNCPCCKNTVHYAAAMDKIKSMRSKR